MASHGGIIGLVLACLWYARRRGHRLMHLLDCVAFSIPPGIVFGRLANFVNGELYGRQAPPDSPTAMKFPLELTQEKFGRLPELAMRVPPPEPVAEAGGLAYADWLIERVREGDPQVTAAVADVLTPRYPSQLFAAGLEGLALLLVMLGLWIRPRKPGVVCGWAIVTYGVGRIIAEFWREPDAHIKAAEFAATGISRGQWLSLAMLIPGVAILIWSHRRDAPRAGGWMPVESAGASGNAGPDDADAETLEGGDEKASADSPGA
jgi:phosphatidylglycerol:prolipoprotein diacylglycerol transferase